MPEAEAQRVAARPGRCHNHPGVAAMATCARCERSLCVTCAVPVRGSVFGPECLSEILEDVPDPFEPRSIVHERGDLVAMAGFGLVIGLSVFPWSGLGDASGPLEAWTLHWSLLAVATALLGLAAAISFRARPRSPGVEIGVYVTLAVVIGLAAYLHRRHPPSLASPSVVPLLAMAGAAVVILGAALKAAEVLGARWGRPERAEA